MPDTSCTWTLQDALGIQAALVKASPISGGASVRASTSVPVKEEKRKPDGEVAHRSAFTGMTTCDYGYDVPAAQQWSFTGEGQIKQGDDTCLLATTPPVQGSCKNVSAKWDLGSANETTAQIKTMETPQRCLKFIGGFEPTGLFLDSCDVEPPICKRTRCASSTLMNQLWYLSRHGQLIASWTHVPIPPLTGAKLDPVPWKDQINPPYCLASAPAAQGPQEPKKPSFVPSVQPDITLCLQVWSGPLSGNDTVVGFVNSCVNGTQSIEATWAELGIAQSIKMCAVRDLYTGKDLPLATGKVSAMVGEHDIAALRLVCPAP
jgi:hypothetical protein